LSIPAQLSDIVMRAMVKSPEGRFQTADEFREALKAVREQRPAQPVAQVPAQAVPQPQGFTPVAVPALVPVPSVRKVTRGAWVGMGAVAAVLGIVAAATLLPHFSATLAGQKPASSTDMQAASTGADTPAPQGVPGIDVPRQPTSTSTTASEGSSAFSALAGGGSATGKLALRPAVKKAQHSAVSVSRSAGTIPAPVATSASPTRPTPAASISSAPAAPAGPSSQEVRQAHERMINLDARASAASSGVQHIRSQQQAQGLEMRGDILASMNRLNSFMNEADRALQQNDVAAANEYMERADTEISTLERFLGR
jgi:serine/threonine-protein kinase